MRGLTGQLGQRRGDKAVEPLDRGDVHPLIGRMRKLDLWPERDHVHAWHLLAEDAALESRVYRLDLGLAPKLTPMHGFHHLEQM